MEKESFFKRYFTVYNIALNGIIAALYAAITIACGPLSYSYMQVRFSEMLNLLCFFNPTCTLGLTVGCLIANAFSYVGPIDMLLGTMSTLVACILIVIYSKFIKNLFSSGIFPVLINAIVVPFTIYISSLGTSNEMILNTKEYFIMFAWVALGEVIAIYGLGYPVFMVLAKKNRSFMKLVNASRNTDFKW